MRRRPAFARGFEQTNYQTAKNIFQELRSPHLPKRSHKYSFYYVNLSSHGFGGKMPEQTWTTVSIFFGSRQSVRIWYYN